jgi:phage terminase small subunit
MPNPKVPPGLKLLRTDEISGTTPARRKPPTVAKLPRVVPPVPESVRADPVAFAEWRRMRPILQRARLLHEASQTALAAYCLAVSRSLQAHARYAPGEASYREVPDLDRSRRAWAGQFGLTPATEDVLTTAATEISDEHYPFAWVEPGGT